MRFADLRDRYGDFYAPAFSVRVGDREFRAADGLLAGVEVDTTLDGADYFSFTLSEPFDRGTGGGDLDWDRFAAGEPVDVAMGYGTRLEPLVLGRIHSVRPEFPSGDAATVTVGGYGLLHDAMRGTKSRSWDERTDSDVVEEVASGYEFAEVNVEETGVSYRKIIQDAESDYRFLETLAERNGFELFARRDAFHFRAPRPDADPVLALRYGDSLRSFSPEASTATQVREVVVRHWDPKRKREIVGSAEREAGDAAAGREVLRRPVESREEAERVAEAALDRIADGLLRGRGEVVGLPELRVGETLRLEGLGERFTNNYYITGVTHRIGSSGYWTSFDVQERTI